jgi:hypothetical protein
MRLTTVIATAALALLLGAPGISSGDGSGMRSSTGGGTSAGSDLLAAALATSVFNYSSETLSQADGSGVTFVDNGGSYGATWDLDTVTASGGTITYEQAGDCVASSKPCIVSSDAMIQMGSGDASKTPTVDIQCLVFSTPSTYPGARDVFGWGVITGSHNQVAVSSANVDVFYDLGTQSQVTQTNGTLHAVCWDGTDPAALTVSLNGSTPAASTDSSGPGARDPEQIFFGGSSSGVDGKGDHLFQAVGWAEDPGLSIQELSQLLYDYWSS